MSKLISHSPSFPDLESAIASITQRIQQRGDLPYITVEQQLQLIKELSEFAFGRFLLQNQGINGFWTNYMLTYPWFNKKFATDPHGNKVTGAMRFMLEKAPIMLATQQRFEIFLAENQKHVKDNARLACIPSGMMGELLYLDFTETQNIYLMGIDYDPLAQKDAIQLAEEKNLQQYCHFLQQDAWQLNLNNEFDLISSNGLNIYEPDANRVSELYRQFYHALKPQGTLVSSFLTYPPTFTEHCEWDMQQINQQDLLLQKIIFVDILEGKWQCYASTEQTRQQLESIGFHNIRFIYDKAKIFPTVVATKT